MMITMQWAVAYPREFKKLLGLLDFIGANPRKMYRHYAYWADLPRCRF